MYAQVRAATFAIVDKEDGLPVCCGSFVTACGVALTAAHEADKWIRVEKGKRMARAITFNDKRYALEVVMDTIGDLNIAVLRLAPAPAAAMPVLPLPDETFTEEQLSGAPVNLVHGSIAWSAGATPTSISQKWGSITSSTATMIHCSMSKFKGHSGAALLIHGQQVIGLHSSGPSTAADAVRLDLPEVRKAVTRFAKHKSA